MLSNLEDILTCAGGLEECEHELGYYYNVKYTRFFNCSMKLRMYYYNVIVNSFFLSLLSSFYHVYLILLMFSQIFVLLSMVKRIFFIDSWKL